MPRLLYRRGVRVANALSVFRFLLAPPMAVATVVGRSDLALALYLLAVASDIADGRFARSTGAASARGGLLDHSADAFFVALGLAVWARHGAVAIPLPVLVALSFALYVRDSGAHRGAPLRGSRLGRANGIAYYALLGALIVADVSALDAGRLLLAASWALVVSTVASMIMRRRALGSLDGERADPGRR